MDYPGTSCASASANEKRPKNMRDVHILNTNRDQPGRKAPDYAIFRAERFFAEFLDSSKFSATRIMSIIFHVIEIQTIHGRYLTWLMPHSFTRPRCSKASRSNKVKCNSRPKRAKLARSERKRYLLKGSAIRSIPNGTQKYESFVSPFVSSETRGAPSAWYFSLRP